MARYRVASILLLAIVAAALALGRDGRAASAAIVPGTITTFAGGGVGDGGQATLALLESPQASVVDGSGNVYIASGCRVRKVTLADVISTIAGTGVCGFGGDSGPATAAQLNGPRGLAVDGSGNLYIADQYNCRIRKVSGGTITTVAGNGVCDYGGDGASALTANINTPWAIALDAAGTTLYIADQGNCRVRRVNGGNIFAFAGNGVCDYSGDNGPATSASLSMFVYGVAVDAGGNVYIADTGNCRIRKVSSGAISTFAGDGTCAFGGDAGLATAAQLQYPGDVRVEGTGNILIADTYNCRIRRVTNGTITTVAGNGNCFYSGDGGAATSAAVEYPSFAAPGSSGSFYISDGTYCVVRKVSGGTISRFAGDSSCYSSGDFGPATNASIGQPYGIAVDGSNNLFIADQYGCRIREVTPAGTISTIAGNGDCQYGGDNGPATSAQLSNPAGVAVDGAGNVYIADTNNCVIRKVAAGTITTVAGNGVCSFGGDAGPATSANLFYPTGVAMDNTGKLYIADRQNCVVRQVSGGTITTFAGLGPSNCGDSGDGGPAATATLFNPSALAVDGSGNVYIADSYNCRIRKVTAGTINAFAGTANSCGYGGDGGPATAALLGQTNGVAVDAGGNVYIGDADNSRVREVHGGIIDTVAGNGNSGFAGDGGSATLATLYEAYGVAVDSSRSIYIADYYNNRIRKVTGQDTDGDGCRDANELGNVTLTGGNRSPDNQWDFFDTPEPVLRPADTSGVRTHAVTLADVIGVLFYVGTTAAAPNQANASGAKYGTDLNANGMVDGQEYDRTIPDQSHPWRSGPPDGAVTIGDAIVGLQQVGANCS